MVWADTCLFIFINHRVDIHTHVQTQARRHHVYLEACYKVKGATHLQLNDLSVLLVRCDVAVARKLFLEHLDNLLLIVVGMDALDGCQCFAAASLLDSVYASTSRHS